jgi:type IV secretion system protein VirB4
LKISDGSLIGFYASLLTGELRQSKAQPLGPPRRRCRDASIRFGKGQFAIEEGAETPRLGPSSMSNPMPPRPGPACSMRSGLPRGTIITHSYTPIERGSITERVKRRVSQMRAAEDIAATVEAQLFEAADKSESGDTWLRQSIR